MEIRDVFAEISSNNFEFTKVSEESVKNEVLKSNTKKSSTSGSIPATILKQSVIDDFGVSDAMMKFPCGGVSWTLKKSTFFDKSNKVNVDFQINSKKIR